jgi:hypothetical protein
MKSSKTPLSDLGDQTDGEIHMLPKNIHTAS